jgi:hypothetical protein
MTGERQQICRGLLYIHGNLAHSRRSINIQNAAYGFDHLGNLLHGEKNAGLVIGPHEADQGRAVIQ